MIPHSPIGPATNGVHRCSNCGQQWIGAHSCVAVLPSSKPAVCVTPEQFSESMIADEFSRLRAKLAETENELRIARSILIRRESCAWCGAGFSYNDRAQLFIAHKSDCAWQRALGGSHG